MKKGEVPEIYILQSEFCRAVSQPKRILIIEKLSDRPKTIKELAEELGFSAPNIAQHFKLLADKGIISKKRKGNNVFYYLEYPEILESSRILRGVMLKVFKKRGDLAKL